MCLHSLSDHSMLPSCTSQLPVNKLTDQLRVGVAQAGFTEALTFALVCPICVSFLFTVVLCGYMYNVHNL